MMVAKKSATTKLLPYLIKYDERDETDQPPNGPAADCARYYRFQINCTFLPKSEIFYMADEKNLCSM